MLKKLLLPSLFGLISIYGYSQNLYKYALNDSITVSKNGVNLTNPWAGGMNNPQFNHMDVNFDCVKDLIIFDRSANIIRVYINDTIPGEASYHYAPEYARFFPESLTSFVLLRDYNYDGKEDIFTYNSGGMRVYKNVSDTVLKFELVTDYLPAIIFGNVSGVYCISVDYPCIDDIDGDGDLDILSVNVWGTFISYYENITTDVDTMIFERSNTCWGNFYENQLTDSLVLGAVCKGGGSSSGSAARHTGATLTTLDLYGNGNKDLLLGDVGYNNMVMTKNGGTPTSANMILVDYQYPSNNTNQIDIPTFPNAFFLDVNNNGRKDLIASTNERDKGIDTGNVWFYDNYGANNLPNFQLSKKNLLVGDQVDVGTMAFPVLADISGDNIPDLMIGNMGYFESYDPNTFEVVYKSQVAFYQNMGPAANPIYEFVTDDLAGLSSKGFTRIAPAFADLDGDGDNDMLFGENNGSLSFYRNIAAPGAMANFVLVADTFMGQFFGVQPSPFLFDVDGDNALDLVLGQKNGNIQLFINQGDSTNPIYTQSVTDTLGGIFNYYPGYQSNAMPYIGKLDGGTNNVLVVADGIGNLLYYDGIDNNLMGTFTLVDSLKVSNSMVSVTGSNLNSNDSIELIVGERTGGLMVLTLDEDAFNYSPYPLNICNSDTNNDTISVRDLGELNSLLNIYPNPNEGNFGLQFSVNMGSKGVISIIDLSGKIVYEKSIITNTGENNLRINTADLKQGVYVIQLHTENSVFRDKLVIQ